LRLGGVLACTYKGGVLACTYKGSGIVGCYFTFLFHLFYIRSGLICTVVRLFVLLREGKEDQVYLARWDLTWRLKD